jgi:outer membrane protein insertion porin family
VAPGGPPSYTAAVRWAITLIGVAVALAGATAARAQTGLVAEDAVRAERSRVDAADDPSFGPVLVIEAVEIRGNVSTAERIIRRALPIAPGDALRAGDPRLRQARFKVLALGYFRSVELSLRRGTVRGQVILTVEVVERGTVILDALYFGTSVATPWWAGLELTERNVLGSGLSLGGGVVHAARGDIEGHDDQWAVELRLADPSILGTRAGAHGSLLYVDASEPYRVAGQPSDGATGNFRAFSYRRIRGTAGGGVNLTPLTRLSAGGRVDVIDADLPADPVRTYPDGRVVELELGLRPERSYVTALQLGLDRDTRADPALPFNGHRVVVVGELGTMWLGGSYTFGTALARYQQWWPLRTVHHVISVHLTGGVVVGDAPLYDLIHVSDLNRLLTPRALGGMVVSTTPSHDLLGADTADLTYGRVGGSAAVQYSYRLFRHRKHVYGGDLFVGAGLWGLGGGKDAQGSDRGLPIDLLIDFGLRLDTEIGIFELTFANALGRVPL